MMHNIWFSIFDLRNLTIFEKEMEKYLYAKLFFQCLHVVVIACHPVIVSNVHKT